ncbi:unnamed protein product, partial [marine sediment metagenome]
SQKYKCIKEDCIFHDNIYENIKSSKYCIIPPTYEPTGYNFELSILSGCIPVIFDHELSISQIEHTKNYHKFDKEHEYSWPYRHTNAFKLDYNKFSIIISSKELIDDEIDLIETLSNINNTQYETMLTELYKIAPYFQLNEKDGKAFSSMLKIIENYHTHVYDMPDILPVNIYSERSVFDSVDICRKKIKKQTLEDDDEEEEEGIQATTTTAKRNLLEKNIITKDVAILEYINQLNYIGFKFNQYATENTILSHWRKYNVNGILNNKIVVLPSPFNQCVS